MTETDRSSRLSWQELELVFRGSEVSWPYVDRRGTVKTVDLHPLRRAGDQPAEDIGPTRPRLREAMRSSIPRWDVLFALLVGCGDAVASVVAAGAGRLVARDGVPVVAGLLMPALWIVCVYFQRGYERRLLGSGAEEFRRVTSSGVVLFGVVAGAATLTHTDVTRTYIAVVVPLTLVGSMALRFVARRALLSARHNEHCLTDVLLVGHALPVLNLASQLERDRGSGMRVVGACVPPGPDRATVAAAGIEVVGDLYDAPRVVRRLHAGAIAVTACTEMHGAALRQLAWDLEGSGVDLVVAPALIEITGPRLHLRPVAGLSLLHVEEPDLSSGRRLLKAVLDRILAGIASVLLLPLLLTIAAAIRLTSAGPALYRQVRIGRGGQRFVLYKFRSMYQDADQRLAELRDRNECSDGVLFKIRADPRVTHVGRLLRRYSLDELPQLLNVLRGHMSLVGPRPPLPSEVERYGAAVRRRLLVKPGVTGLWQVSGRSDLTWDDAVRLDLRYVENWSLMLDLQIMWRTIAAVVRGSGAY